MWYLNPFKFLDDDELLGSYDDAKASARAFFHDLLVNRPVEFPALFHLFLLAYSNLELTDRQQEALEARTLALQEGRRDVQVAVASQLGISQPAASKLLHRADERLHIKMLYSAPEFHIVDNSTVQWCPTEAQIKAQMARMDRICAGCGRSVAGRYAVCWQCGETYGRVREEWQVSKDPHKPAPLWLLQEARRIDAQHRRDAINALYELHLSEPEALEEIALAKVA